MTSMEDLLRRVAEGDLSPAEALSAMDGAGAHPPADLGEDVDGYEDDEEPAGDQPGGEPTPGPPVDLGKAGPVGAEADEPGPPAPPQRPRTRGSRPPRPPRPPGPLGAGAPPGAGDATARVIRLRTAATALDVYADPAVAEVLVSSGSPRVRRDGDALVVEHDFGRTDGPGGGFAFVSHLPRRLAAAIPGALDERVVVRVNPALLVDVDVSAVSLRLWGCEGGVRLRLAASSAKLDRISGPIHIDAQSSSVKGSMRPTGDSHIRCESSSVKLGLLSGSDVRIEARNRMGKVVLPHRRSRSANGDLRATVGAGRDRLVVDATMSSVMIGGER
jgi:hypothetical protein